MSARTTNVITVEGRSLSLSNLEKPLYPNGFNKGDIAHYYARIAEAMLPHLAGRAITLKRYPSGVNDDFFFEKCCPPHRPDWVTTADIASDRKGSINFCVIDDLPTLIWAANLASIEFHAPLARADQPDQPTAMVFDLDPGAPATFLDCLKLGVRVRDHLENLGLQSLVKTSGNKGLHLYVPLNTAVDFDQTKSFARSIAEHFAATSPQSVTARMAKAERVGRVFIDWSQNDVHKTTVAVYSLRATEQPSVSTPIAWAEVEKAIRTRNVAGLRFDPDAAVGRVEKLGDLFGVAETLRQKLPKIAAY